MTAVSVARIRMSGSWTSGWVGKAWSPLLALVPVASLAADQGGYFPPSWGWATVGLLWTAGIAVVFRSALRVGRFEAAFVLLWAAVGVWIASSAWWSTDPPQTVSELERVLVYVSACGALVLIVSPEATRRLLGGLAIAVCGISIFSLGTRLFPGTIRVYDPTATYRLAQPLGYWNGLSIFAAIGIMLALGFAARARLTAVRALAAAPLVFLAATFYFTYGRTGWLALGCGLVAALAVDPRRLQLLGVLVTLAPLPAAAVWLASSYPGLTHEKAGLAQAAHDGHRLAVQLAVLAALAAVASGLYAFTERRVQVPPQARRAFVGLVVALCVLASIGVVHRYGSPATLASKGWREFKAPPVRPNDLNKRLLNFSSNGRYDYWRVAWDEFKTHPVLGSGAGSYERYFLRHQPPDVSRVRDAHGLYIETLAELGPIGLALLVAALAVPLVVAARSRRRALTGIATGAYVAFLVHAAFDWDWELPAVTLAALICGAAIVIGERGRGSPPLFGVRARVAAVAGIVVLGAFASVALAGNSELGASNSSREAARWDRAALQARRAATFLPWSAEPWAALGKAQLGAGEPAEARSSFRKALSIDDGDWTLWRDLARASTGPARQRALRQAVILYPRSGLQTGNQ